MKTLPTIYLMLPGKGNCTVIVYEDHRVQTAEVSFHAFVERFCHRFGTCLHANRKVTAKHFNYRKNIPLYIASLDHLVMVPTSSLRNDDSFLYNPHQIRNVIDLDGRSQFEFLDGTRFEVNIASRNLIAQIKRAHAIRQYYAKAHPFYL